MKPSRVQALQQELYCLLILKWLFASIWGSKPGPGRTCLSTFTSAFSPTFLPFTLCPRPVSPYWKPCEGLPKVTSQTCFLVSPSFFDPGSWLCIPPQFFLFFFFILYLTGLTDCKLLLSDTAWHCSVMVAHWCWRRAVVVLWGAQWLGDSAFHWGYGGEPPITSKYRFQIGEWGFTVNSICFPW